MLRTSTIPRQRFDGLVDDFEFETSEGLQAFLEIGFVLQDRDVYQVTPSVTAIGTEDGERFTPTPEQSRAIEREFYRRWDREYGFQEIVCGRCLRAAGLEG